MKPNPTRTALTGYRLFWRRAAAVGVLLSSTSCSSVSQYVKNTWTPNGRSEAIAQSESAKTKQSTPGTVTLKPSASEGTGELAAKQPSTPEASSTTALGSRTAALEDQETEALNRLARGEDPFAAMEAGPVSQVSAEVVVPERRQPLPEAITTATTGPAEIVGTGGQPQSGMQPSGQPYVVMPESAACPPSFGMDARPFPRFEITDDEYVRDGGYKGSPDLYDVQSRVELGLEDTVAEFKDHEGRVHVKPSTVAEIYSPRFGEVRTATLPQLDDNVVKAHGHQDQAKVAGLNTKTVTSEQRQSDELMGMQTRARASGLSARITDDQLDKAIAAQNHVKLVNVYEDIRFIQEGTYERISSAVLERTVMAALEWADGRRPIILAQDQSGQLIQGRFSAQDMTGVEDRRTPGDLKIIKVADKAAAHPGEIVTFTIRFDNIGGRDLFKVRLIDNLSPRLEYIEGSIQSSLDGKVDAVDNGAGSQLLTFEFDNPLKGKTGGYVSFKCRVR